MQDIRSKAQDLHQKLQVIENAMQAQKLEQAKRGEGRFYDLVNKDKEYMRIVDARIALGVCIKPRPPEHDPAVKSQFAAYEPVALELIAKYS